MSVRRVAIVGAGPAGLYAIEHLLEQRRMPVRIDLVERLPTPWGLVRSGVAPDHPEKKLVTDRLFGFLLADPRVRFLGNTEVGRDVTHDELVAGYDAVLYSVGANSDAELGLPGEGLANHVPARRFVGFYNGHPDHAGLPVDLGVSRAVVVGNGNVAVDIARILTMPLEKLRRTDISEAALAVLAESRIEEVVLLGRRGPLQAAFKNPELEELAELPGVDVTVSGADLPTEEELRSVDGTLRRKMRLLRRIAERPPAGRDRRIDLRFLESPVALLGQGSVERLVVARNEVVRAEDGRLRARPTGETREIEAGLLISAVGYRGHLVPGLPFDSVRGLVRHEGGRVLGGDGTPLPGVYVAGWAKRGSTGIIGSNKKCSAETVASLLADLEGRSDPERAGLPVAATAVDHRGWTAIDRAERQEGRDRGRPRVKLTSYEELLRTAGLARGGAR